jgi:hypothetical protein
VGDNETAEDEEDWHAKVAVLDQPLKRARQKWPKTTNVWAEISVENYHPERGDPPQGVDEDETPRTGVSLDWAGDWKDFGGRF